MSQTSGTQNSGTQNDVHSSGTGGQSRVTEPGQVSGSVAGSVVTIRSPRLGWVLTLTGAVALIASFVLTVEKLRLSTDPFYVPSCSFNDTFSCSTIMQSAQSSALGFPNPLLGLVGFSVVITLGVVLLSGVALPRWVWRGFSVGVAAGAGFVLWLIYTSLFVVGALCPYCMVVWAMMAILTPTVLLTAWRTPRHAV